MKYSNKVASFLRLFVFSRKSMDAFIETLSTQSSVMGRGALNEMQKEALKKTFASDDFLVQFSEGFRKFFTEDEISELIRIYELSVMQKMSECGKAVMEPLYGAMQREAQSILKGSENDLK